MQEARRFVEHRYHVPGIVLPAQFFQYDDVVARKFNVAGRVCRRGVATRPDITLCNEYAVCIVKVKIGVFDGLFVRSVFKFAFLRPRKGACIGEPDIEVCLVYSENLRGIIRNDSRFIVRTCTQCATCEQP